MGARNVAAAYVLFAGKVPPLSMNLLTYMALVSRDDDKNPWYGQGHAALASAALGRSLPIQRADVKAVERGVTPLLAAGAIVADRRASVRRDGAHTVRYRLQLDLAPPLFQTDTNLADVPRNVGDVTGAGIDQSLVDNPSQDSQRPPESGPHVPHIPGPRPPESVPTSPTFRGTEELRRTQGGAKGGITPDLRTDASGPRTNTTPENDHDSGCVAGYILNGGNLTRCRCNLATASQELLPWPSTQDTHPAAPTNTAPPTAASSAPVNAKADPTPTQPQNPPPLPQPTSGATGQPQPHHPDPNPAEAPSPPAKPATPPSSSATPTPAASGSWPIVHVRQHNGRPPEPAELREDNPQRPNVVKIVYLASRTSAWVARTRIVETLEHAA